MNDREMEQLIRHALECEELESGGSRAPAARRDCPSMARLEELARPGGSGRTDEESGHLHRCPICAARLRALRGDPLPPPRAPRSALLTRSVLGLPFVALAAGLLLVLIPLIGLLMNEGSAPAPEAVRIDYLPSEAQNGSPRIDRFRLEAQRDCALVAVLRGWTDECACLEWSIPERGDGHDPLLRRLLLRRGDRITLEVNVTDHPPVEQLLVVIVADEAECLPADASDALEFLACLNEGSPPAAAELDVELCIDSGPVCSPGDVEVVGRRFVVY